MAERPDLTSELDAAEDIVLADRHQHDWAATIFKSGPAGATNTEPGLEPDSDYSNPEPSP